MFLSYDRKKVNHLSKKSIKSTPESLEMQENLMINLAMDLAERQLREGTASSQVISHYLKLASSKERLEREKLQEENKLLRAKTEALEAARDVEELYKNAITAMSAYRGSDRDE